MTLLAQDPTLADFGRDPWWLILIKIVVAFAFGLLHGFGFATALSEAGLPRSDLPLALVSFNVGVELGQLGFVALILGLERSFRVLQVHWLRSVGRRSSSARTCAK